MLATVAVCVAVITVEDVKVPLYTVDMVEIVTKAVWVAVDCTTVTPSNAVLVDVVVT